MDIKKVVENRRKSVSCGTSTSNLQNNDKSKVSLGKSKISQDLSNKKLNLNTTSRDKSFSELPSGIIKNKSESSKQIIKKCGSIKTKNNTYKQIRKVINKGDVSLSNNSKNIKPNIELRKSETKSEISDKNESNEDGEISLPNLDAKNIITNIKLRENKLKDKLLEKNRRNKIVKASSLTISDCKNIKTNAELEEDKVKSKLSKEKRSKIEYEVTATDSDHTNIKTNIELRKSKVKAKVSEKKASNKEDSKNIKTDIALRKDGVNKLSENLLFDDIEKNIYEDFISPMKENTLNHKAKLNKKNFLNEQLHQPTCSKMDEKQKVKRSSKIFQNDLTVKKLNKKVEVKLLENLSFEDIEKKIYEDFVTPMKENLSNHKTKLNKNKLLNEQLHNPTCSKTDEKQKVKRNSKIFQSDSLVKKSNKKVAGKRNSAKKISKTEELGSSDESDWDSPVQKSNKKVASKKNSAKKISKTEELESSDESDWEDVDELNEILRSKEDKPNSSIQIELKAENPLWGIHRRKRRSQREQIEDYLRKEINKSIREVHENMHKTHLLCLLSHGMYLNRLLCSEILISCALSIIPKQYYSPKRIDINHLEKFVNWFYSHMKVKNMNDQKSLKVPEISSSKTETIEDMLIKIFESKSPTCFKEVVLMFVATSRAVGMTVRYVQSLTPISWKPPSANLIKPKKETDNEVNETFVSTKTENPENAPKKKSRKMLSSDSEAEHNDKDTKKRKKKKTHEYNSEDSDFDISTKFKKNPSKTKGKKSDESDDRHNSKKGEIKDWAEVYVEEEEKWIPVDITRNQIHCANEIERRTWNLAYVIAFNPDNTVKDVTKRYMSSWLSYNKKVRLDNKWWSDSLKPFLSLNDRRNKEEDREMDEILELQPLPKKIIEYKNHPLYALQRHLLKFEAIYPPDASVVGYIKGEPVYPRECVYNLGGREKWIKDAKTVKVDEEPYKIVKALPKWDRSTCQLIKDRPLELFGEWQVEDYEPPIAKNGRVPRNEYGNVELFKLCMLPRGCVLLPFNGLNRIARKLSIDCAPAITGFDYHSGACHPTYDGFVVCEEFKDILLDAWRQDQIEQTKKEEEKRSKRIYDNWKRLINGITLKERLQEKYGVKLKDENHSKKKEPVKKIKQKDLNEMPQSIITHSVSNVRIDFETCVTDGMKKKRPIKRKLKSDENKSINKNNDSMDKSLQSSDSEDISDTEKRKKIRSILDWNPNTNGDHSDPALSDESESETNLAEDRLKNSSLLLTPISESHPIKKLSSATKFTKSSKKSTIMTGDVMLSSSSDSEEGTKSPPLKRRSLRASKSKNNYKDNDESPSDISVADSDTGDSTYYPIPD